MAIYKLGDLINVHDNYRSSGYPTPNELQTYGIPFVKVADFNPNGFTQTKEYISEEKFNSLPKKGKITKGALLVSAYGTIDVSMFNGDAGQMSSGVKELVIKNSVLIKKYLHYWLIKNIKYMGTQSAVFLQLTIDEINKTNIDLPRIQTQQKIIDIIEQNEKLFLTYSNCVRIDSVENVQSDMKSLIDIIEPIERQIELLNMHLKRIEQIGNWFSTEHGNAERMIDSCVFEKGKNHDGSDGVTPFLNVSAANGKVNNYCDSISNTRIGDVMLSLDGNTGIVNNFLEGFNGYLYKVSSKKVENFEIYYSLKSKENQDIIKLNETGTTIKHSPNSKKELKIFSFKNRDVLEQTFGLEILLKKQIVLFEKCKNQLIQLLVK